MSLARPARHPVRVALLATLVCFVAGIDPAFPSSKAALEKLK